MPLIKEFMVGNCKVKIYDDYMAKTDEENQKILDDLSAYYVRMRRRQIAEKAEKEFANQAAECNK